MHTQESAEKQRKEILRDKCSQVEILREKCSQVAVVSRYRKIRKVVKSKDFERRALTRRILLQKSAQKYSGLLKSCLCHATGTKTMVLGFRANFKKSCLCHAKNLHS